MRSRSPLALAGALIILLLAVVGFAAFSTTPIETSQTADGVVLPPTATGRIAGAVMASRLGPGVAEGETSTPAPEAPAPAPTVRIDGSPDVETVTTTEATTTTTIVTTTTTEAPVVTTTTTEPPPTTTTTTEPPPATTTTTEPPPTTTTEPPPAEPLPEGAEQWRSLVTAYWPAELVDDALAVIWCESRGDPDALNPASGAAGLFQFLPSTWDSASASAGWSGADVFDPEANIAVAYWLYAAYDEPWQQWNCSP